jgi:hypothetical protein
MGNVIFCVEETTPTRFIKSEDFRAKAIADKA